MSNLLDVNNEECKKLRRLSHKLENYSNAFSITGNYEMSGKLYKMASEVFDSQKALSDVVSEHIHEGFKQAQQASANILKTALAVSEMKTGH